MFKIWKEKIVSLAEEEEYLVVGGRDWKGAYEQGNLIHLSGKLILSNQKEVNFHSVFPSEFLKIWQKEFATSKFSVNNITFKTYSKYTTGGIILWTFTTLLFGVFLAFYIKLVVIDNIDLRSAFSVFQDQVNLEELSKIAQEEGMFEKVMPNKVKESFADVGGYEEAKEDLKEIAQLIKEKSEIFFDKGTILYGPPGTGKTLLAKAFAREAGLPFFRATGDDLAANAITAALGSVETRLRLIFNEARRFNEKNNKGNKIVVFIDEFDKMGAAHISYGQGGVELLKMMGGGFKTEKYEDIVLIVTTNHIGWFGEGVLRSGRLDNQFKIDYPNFLTLEKIIKIFIKKYKAKISSDCSEEDIINEFKKGVGAENETRFVGADVERVFKLLEFCQRKSKKDNINKNIFDLAINKVLKTKNR
ncbi:AAA family ATPase [endosymbiont GvMRE of Glomus versiforme]|uniref:AAA family ATPase n=1 Tax=endosymbiont GvMRE of Glomus versiforme TaxID=2039283 RepID=UPI0015597663|nr:ATP-binding protein [endosymbiont GvMRE of Glomus versiforme]